MDSTLDVGFMVILLLVRLPGKRSPAADPGCNTGHEIIDLSTLSKCSQILEDALQLRIANNYNLSS
jgi:hypothetical protein